MSANVVFIVNKDLDAYLTKLIYSRAYPQVEQAILYLEEHGPWDNATADIVASKRTEEFLTEPSTVLALVRFYDRVCHTNVSSNENPLTTQVRSSIRRARRYLTPASIDGLEHMSNHVLALLTMSRSRIA